MTFIPGRKEANLDSSNSNPAAEKVIVSRDSIEAGLLAEQVRLVYKQIPTLYFGAVIIPVITSIALWNTVPRPLLLGWTGALWLLATVRMLLVRRFNSRERSDEDVLRWRHQTTITGIVSGSLFGIGNALFVPYCGPYEFVFITMFIVGIVGSGLVAQSAYPPAFLSFSIATIAPYGLSLMFRPEPALAWISALMLVYLLSQLGHGRTLNRTISESIRLHFDNMELVERLRQEKQRAEQAVVAKSRFLASASHDLRQPLHALGLFVEAQQQEKLSPAAEDLRRQMGASVEALGGLINGLLDMSKLEAGTLETAPRPLALAPTFRRLEREFSASAEAKGLRLELEPGHYWVVSDPQHLERILRNLLDNALKYTDSGSIRVQCREQEDRLAIEVTDTGIGIDAATKKRIFDEFFQAGNPERDSTKGLGLGLSIVRGLAERLGHSVEVESTPGEGSRFLLWVPRTPPRAESLEVSGPRARSEGLRVLVVDDDAPIRSGLEAVLTSWGCQVAGYDSAVECMDDRERAWIPDIMLVDFRLRQGQTGDKVTEELRGFFGSDIPAIIVTGETSPEPLQRIAEAGLPVLHKPLKPARLRAALSMAGKRDQSSVTSLT